MKNNRTLKIALIMAILVEFQIAMYFINKIRKEKERKEELLENEKILNDIERQQEESQKALDKLEKDIDKKILKLKRKSYNE